MAVIYVSGDPLLTRAQVLAFGHNARGRAPSGALETLLHTRYPAAFATYNKQCRANTIKSGTLWLWRETQPMLGFLVVRDSSVGATRLRYVENIALTLARDFRRESLTSVAIAPFWDSVEWTTFKPIFDYWLGRSDLPCVIYERYAAGMQVE
jgi:hypothetical protein